MNTTNVTKQTFFKTLADSRMKANKAFLASPPAEQRVQIAKDVLKALELRTLVATSGTYVGYQVYDAVHRNGGLSNEDASLQDTLKDVEECRVCAKGAIFLCMVGRRNNVSHEDLRGQTFGGYGMSEALGGIFDPDQLNKIEAAFENWTNGGPKTQANSEGRLKAIMQNIVRNAGTFVPNAYGGVDIVPTAPHEIREAVVTALGL